MQCAPLPKNEAARLKVLKYYEVLDTKAESQFDELTELAATICEVPIALVSLIDTDRQWFKSKVGIEAEQTPREIAFCAHSILGTHILEIPDATQDERFYDNPLVTGEPHIRFYAGAPLITPEGQALGTLCVIGERPRMLNDTQRMALNNLSKAVVSQLELRIKNKELQRLNEFRRDFISYISHELRTPLNAVLSFSDLLKEELAKFDAPDTVYTQLDYIRFSGDRILHIVNSVLDLNQIEAGKMQLSMVTVNPKTVFKNIAIITQAIAKQANCVLNFHIAETLPTAITLDEGKFSQVALNLISNAIKFSIKKKHVDVYADIKNGILSYAVRDQGIGMSEEEQKSLFTQYRRLKKTMNIQGTGLGLNICKGLVDLMNGEIHLNSKPDKGTLVKLTIPVVIANEDELIPHTYQPQQDLLPISRDVRILIVEDHHVNQAVIRSVFDNLQLPIDIVDSGESCLEQLHINSTQKPYDIVFMDIRLPGISGLETTAALRKTHADLHVVALTADVISNKDAFSNVGIEHILSKPIDRNALVAVLNQCLG
jgi:signal transduction histidine kinase/CheY-like chemotaxis protein